MKLLFVGDVMLGRLVNQELKARPPEYPWGNTLDVFRSADVRFCNLECSLSDRGVRLSPETKAFHFRSDAGNVEVLKRAGIDAVSLAKNIRPEGPGDIPGRLPRSCDDPVAGRG